MLNADVAYLPLDLLLERCRIEPEHACRMLAQWADAHGREGRRRLESSLGIALTQWACEAGRHELEGPRR